MSYTIEYNRQFIRSEEGITPCWLAGDNNVYTRYGKYERRCRDWGVFHGLLGVQEEDILKAVEPSLGGYGEHWRRGGKWVDDEGLKRWVHSGCQRAASVESIIEANGIGSIHCYITISEDRVWRTEESRYIRTTEEFDDWLRAARPRIAELRAAKCYAWPVVDFILEDLKAPTVKKEFASDDKVLLKHKSSYLAEKPIRNGSSSWCKDIRKAYVMSYEEAMEIKKANGNYGWLAESKVIKAPTEPYDVVIRIVSGSHAGEYFTRRTRGYIYSTRDVESAHYYKSLSAAKAALSKFSDIAERAWGGKLAPMRVSDIW